MPAAIQQSPRSKLYLNKCKYHLEFGQTQILEANSYTTSSAHKIKIWSKMQIQLRNWSNTNYGGQMLVNIALSSPKIQYHPLMTHTPYDKEIDTTSNFNSESLGNPT